MSEEERDPGSYYPQKWDRDIAESEEATRRRPWRERLHWPVIVSVVIMAWTTIAVLLVLGSPFPPAPTPEYVTVFVKDPARNVECVYHRVNETGQHMLMGCFDIDRMSMQNAEVYFSGVVGEGDELRPDLAEEE